MSQDLWRVFYFKFERTKNLPQRSKISKLKSKGGVQFGARSVPSVPFKKSSDFVKQKVSRHGGRLFCFQLLAR